ncbi:ribonuclease H-like domain-containing protein [Tanacetum coccineum]
MRRSTSGCCVFLGNNLLSWSSKRQPTLSRSSAEAEYRGVANAVVETCWIWNLLRGSVSDGVTIIEGPLSTAGGLNAFWSTAGGSPCTWNFTSAVCYDWEFHWSKGGAVPG